MGLDIDAYRTVKFVHAIADDDDGDYAATERALYPNPDFPEQADGLKRGVYAVEGGTGFRAGSYSGYNYWRSELAALVGKTADRIHRDDVRTGPFVELINFSDCEGVIGPTTSAKLAGDFAKWQAEADSHGDDYWRQKYAAWRESFGWAANGGAVVFG